MDKIKYITRKSELDREKQDLSEAFQQTIEPLFKVNQLFELEDLNSELHYIEILDLHHLFFLSSEDDLCINHKNVRFYDEDLNIKTAENILTTKKIRSLTGYDVTIIDFDAKMKFKTYMEGKLMLEIAATKRKQEQLEYQLKAIQ